MHDYVDDSFSKKSDWDFSDLLSEGIKNKGWIYNWSVSFSGS